MEAVRDENRLKTTVIRLKPYDTPDAVVKEVRTLTDAIKKMMATAA